MAATALEALKKEKNAKLGKIAAPPLRDLFRLKFFRFKCRDLSQTAEFYTSIGMTVDYQEEQECVPPLQAPVSAVVERSSAFSKFKANQSMTAALEASKAASVRKSNTQPTFKDGDASHSAFMSDNKQKEADIPTILVLGLSFHSASHDSGLDKVQLLFEEDIAVCIPAFWFSWTTLSHPSVVYPQNSPA
jgi:predicted lactoylglutathione lyase